MHDIDLTHLEDLLASELREVQLIETLTVRERDALQQADLSRLQGIVHDKQAHMDELDRLESVRSYSLDQIAAQHPDELDPQPDLDDVLGKVDRRTANRLRILRDGIAAHLDHCQSLNAGNRALLQIAADRNSALRDFLTDLFESSDSYGPLLGSSRSLHADNYYDWSG